MYECLNSFPGKTAWAYCFIGSLFQVNLFLINTDSEEFLEAHLDILIYILSNKEQKVNLSLECHEILIERVQF